MHELPPEPEERRNPWVTIGGIWVFEALFVAIGAVSITNGVSEGALVFGLCMFAGAAVLHMLANHLRKGIRKR